MYQGLLSSLLGLDGRVWLFNSHTPDVESPIAKLCDRHRTSPTHSNMQSSDDEMLRLLST